jgi:hypothetical protein
MHADFLSLTLNLYPELATQRSSKISFFFQDLKAKLTSFLREKEKKTYQHF